MKCRQKEKLIVSIVKKTVDSHVNYVKHTLTNPERKVFVKYRRQVLEYIHKVKTEIGYYDYKPRVVNNPNAGRDAYWKYVNSDGSFKECPK